VELAEMVCDEYQTINTEASSKMLECEVAQDSICSLKELISTKKNSTIVDR
jgi:hypothetical protein